MQTDVSTFLDRDDSEFIETLASEIVAHLDSIDSPIYGYAILTGEDASVSDLVAAYNPYSSIRALARDNTYRFDVHGWEMCPRAIDKAYDVLDRLNTEFRSLYPARPDVYETDQVEDAHVAKLHDSIIASMVRAKSLHQKLQDERIFCVFTIPDSMIDVDVRASETLNSKSVHKKFVNWR